MSRNRGFILMPGQTIYSGDYLSSNSGNYYAVLQEDNNFVVYVSHHFHPANALWSSKTNNSGNGIIFFLGQTICNNFFYYLTTSSGKCHLVMQEDHNLVLYDQSGTPLWATSTHHRGPCIGITKVLFLPVVSSSPNT